jgi:site-specific DNA recombinase
MENRNLDITYDLYCRKSQESEERQVLSLEAQERETRELANRLGIKVRKIWIESFSAKAPSRTVFNQMMGDVSEGKVQGLIAWHPDRLSRNSVDGGLIIYYLDNGLLKDLLFSSYNFENTPQGKWMLNIQFGQSKYYVDQLSVNVKRGNKQKLENGWKPSMAPTGYLNDVVNKTIIIDQDRFPILQNVIKDIASGKSSPVVGLKTLNEVYSYKTVQRKKTGGKHLARSTFYNLLSNPFYCGIIRHNGKEYPGKHDAMISPSEFDKLQIMLGEKGKPRKQIHDFPFTGFIRCGECGSMVTAEKHCKRSKDNQVVEYVYYRCTKKNPNIKCSQPYVSSNDLNDQVDEYLSKITIPEEFRDWALKYLSYINESESIVEKKSFENIFSQINSTREELRNLTKMRIKGQIDDVIFEDEKSNIQRELTRLEALQNQINKDANEWTDVVNETVNFAYSARKKFETGDPQEKRYIFSKLGSNFILKDRFLALKMNKMLFAFTTECREQLEPLELDENTVMKLENNNLLPADLTWLPNLDSNQDRRLQRPLSYH